MKNVTASLLMTSVITVLVACTKELPPPTTPTHPPTVNTPVGVSSPEVQQAAPSSQH